MGWIGAAAAVLACGLALLLGPGLARATGCDNWIGGHSVHWEDAQNWDSGAPTASSDVCIGGSTTYSVLIESNVEIHSLSLGGSAGTQTLELLAENANGNTPLDASLKLDNGGTVGANGVIQETSSCSPCGSGAGQSLLNVSGGTLTNGGILTLDPGLDNGNGGRVLQGNITNTGSLDVNTGAQFKGGTLDNQGAINLGNNDLSLLNLANATVTNDTGGTITNGGQSGALLVGATNTFNEAGGATSPSTANPSNPAVIMDNTGYTGGTAAYPVLDYQTSGASTVESEGGTKLSGNLAPGQNLVIDGDAPNSCVSAQTTASTSFTNGGTITLTGPCDAGLLLSSGTLTNTGSLVAAGGSSSVTREINGSLTNSGQFTINGPTAFDKPGTTLTQTGGTTKIAPGQALDISGSGATFQLQSGLLEGGSGQTQSEITGSVNNTGGNVMPGSTTAPGLMTFSGSYTQGSGGSLTEVVKGTKLGTGYSQLNSIGPATIGGRLAIVALSGFKPPIGTPLPVLGASHVSGHFSSLTGQFPPEGSFPPGWTSGWKLQYASGSVSILGAAAAGLKVIRSGSGSVTSSPGGINCGSKCIAPFFKVQTVTLTAHPASGHRFKGWSGACSGTATTCRVKMSTARTVTAKFS